jgi:uncharacterized membrane protein
MDLNTSKNLGGIGAILMFIGVFPYVGTYFIIPFLGLILLMIGAKGLADNYNEPGIFNNALYGVVAVIVGGIVTAALAFVAFVSFFSSVGFTFADMSNWASLASQVTSTEWMNAFFAAAGYIFLTLVILFVFVLISAIFFRKSMALSASKTGVGLFSSAGLVLLIGAVLTIIFFGVILLWISLLLIAIAFFQIRTQPAQSYPPPPAQTTQQI